MRLSPAALGGVALVGIGLGALAAPGRSARGYGLPTDDADARALVRALGARDLVLGLLLGAAGDRERRRLLALLAIVGATDASVVFSRRGRSRALGVHALGTIGLLVAAGASAP